MYTLGVTQLHQPYGEQPQTLPELNVTAPPFPWGLLLLLVIGAVALAKSPGRRREW